MSCSEYFNFIYRSSLIGNGDLQTPEQVVHAFKHYKVDGVMIARAALGRPWLFAQAAAALAGKPIPPEPTLDEQRACMLRHYDLVVERFGPQKGTMLMRKFACCYAQSKHGARHFRTHVVRVETQEEFYGVVEKYFPRELGPSSVRASSSGLEAAQQNMEACTVLDEDCCE